MSTPDGRFHLSFNGEIYNYVELRRELESLGHRFGSHSDTEALLAQYVASWLKGFEGLVLQARSRPTRKDCNDTSCPDSGTVP
jgi:glucosamine 6-phosphate synthetase-like amidotransferase/phosphosugar isomerase protein